MAMAVRRPDHSCVEGVHNMKEVICDGPELTRSCGASLTKESTCRLCESSTIDWPPHSEIQEEICISLLELAAGNDLDTFKQAVEAGAKLEEPENWYTRVFGTNQMAMEQRTALMIASLYGSVEVLSYILSSIPCPVAVVNKAWGADEITALHCATAGGSDRAVEVMKLLLDHGASANMKDVQGRRPVDVLVVPPKLLPMKASIEDMLNSWPTNGQNSLANLPISCNERSRKGIAGLRFISDPLSLPDDECFDVFSPEFVDKSYNLTLPTAFLSLSCGDSSPRISSSSPSSPKFVEDHTPNFSGEGVEKPRDFPVDASLPDIKNSIYTTDEFRMFSFKIRPCSRAYSHDWTECPFVHPGENARRRDPRRYHYSCVPCPDFRKGACRRGDACEYAHGVFECWLHPAQYRTRLCKDGTNCARRVCFFAHITEELRPLFISMGSAVPSPRDARSMSPPLPPGSPAQVLLVPPFSPSNPSANTPPLSPSGSSMHSSVGGGWSQSNIPSLHLPGGSLHMSRLRAALNARDIPVEDLDDSCDFDPRLESQFSSLSIHNRPSPVSIRNTAGKLGKYGNLGLSIPPTNLQDIFASEIGSPLAMSHNNYVQEHTNYVQEHSHLSPQFQTQLQSQISSLLSPRSSQRLSQLQSFGKNQTALPSPAHSPLLNIISPWPDSTRISDLDLLASGAVSSSPDSAAILRSKKAAFALRGRESWSSKDLSGSASLSSWSDWGSPSGKPDWGVQGQDLHKLRKSASFASHGPTEPEVSWVQSHAKDGTGHTDISRLIAPGGEAGPGRGLRESMEHLLPSWVDQLPKDKMII